MTRRIITALSITSLMLALVLGAASNRTEAAGQALRFTSPSGNIDCVMDSGSTGEVYVDCTAQNAKWQNEKPQPKDCDLDWDPHEITLSATSKGNVVKSSLYVGGCRGDIGPLCFNDDADRGSCEVLKFGEKRTLKSITCESKSTGILCATNRGKRLGFLLGRNSWTRIS
jgi:hypothetical protein